MLPGYNHNIRYKAEVYHIQTEDSGVQSPHIITHLFVGGNILESRKTSYADIVTSERLSEMLVDLMQDQHKQMLKDLISGKLDPKIGERSAGAGKLNGPAPLNVEAGAQERASLSFGGISKKPAEAPQKAPAAPPTPVQMPAQVPPEARPAIPSAAPSLQSLQPQPAEEASPASSFFGSAPPVEKVIEADTLAKAFESHNKEAVDSIFGEDLISEKSLDEVILSYLSEEIPK